MALIYEVVYPSGGRANAYGYPRQILVVQEIPRGPEACYLDEVEVDFADYREPLQVTRIVGGPRRPTVHVRVDGDRDAWMDARDAEGWNTVGAPDDPTIVWVVADRDVEALAGTGAQIVRDTLGVG